MKRIAWFFMICLLTLCVLSTAYADGEVCEQDSFLPQSGNCGYDVRKYIIDASWNDTDNIWSVRETIELTSEWDTDEVVFDLTNAYTVSSVLLNNVSAEFIHEGDKLTVKGNFAHDTHYIIDAAFSGQVQRASIFHEADYNETHAGEPFCVLPEPNVVHNLIVVNDHPKDRAYYDITMTVPAKYTAATIGMLTSVTEADGTVIIPEDGYVREAPASDAQGTVTLRFVTREEAVPYNVPFCVGAYDISLTDWGNGTVQVDFIDAALENAETRRELAGRDREFIEFMESYLGDYPYEEAGSILTAVNIGGALETMGRPIYDPNECDEFVFIHEIAHQWMGDMMSIKDWSDIWIKEGFATLAEELWIRETKGEDVFKSAMRNSYEYVTDTEHLAIGANVVAEYMKYRQFDDEDTLTLADAKTVAALLCTGECDTSVLEDAAADGMIPEEMLWQLMPEVCTEFDFRAESIESLVALLHNQDLFLRIQTDLHAPIGPKQISADFSGMYSSASYQGGSLVYYALLCHLGEETFWNCIRGMLNDYRYSVIDTEDFINTFSKYAGEDLTELINSWLYYDPVPAFPEAE